MRRLLKGLAWVAGGLLVVLLLLLSPVAYVETFCRGSAEARGGTPLIAEAYRRPEANSYLTYPEWHIVYAYDGLAEVLKSGDEHRFPYLASIRDFWSADCALTREADRRGGADGETRLMIATIGVSFTLEMLLKGAWEETIGRLTALWRGPTKTPQDIVARDMAADYAAFLRHTPWYAYAFRPWTEKLWAAPVDGLVRGWERRLALGAEWSAKSGYAELIGGAAAAGPPAALTIRSVVSGLPAATLAAIRDVKVVGEQARGLLIETPRYARFTQILAQIARAGGTIEEIAGNARVMVSLTRAPGADAGPLPGKVLLRLRRNGFAGDRVLAAVPIADLAPLLRAEPLADPGIEHIYDY